MTSILFILLGITAGVASGFVGIGGGIIIVPALVLLFKFSQQTAQGTTLALLLPPIGVFAVMAYYKAGFINIPAAALIAAGFMAGSYFGSKVAVSMNTVMLQRIFGVFLLAVAVKMILNK